VQQTFQRKLLNFAKDGEKFFMVPREISGNHEIAGAMVLKAVNELMKPVTKDCEYQRVRSK
jgi:hypothetical protein